MSDYDWVGPVLGAASKYGGSMIAGNEANGELQGAYDEMLRNLQERFGDYNNLGKAGYQDVTAESLGPSALEGIQSDPEARLAQQEAMAKLSELAANGGLSLADMRALNEVQGNLNRNTMARRKGLENSFAARGQLGSGAQLATDLAGQQQAAQSANQAGESAAAQAQERAMQAILKKGEMARSMSGDDYARKADAARARDSIMARNAAARTDASKYNNTIRGQAFEDELSKARGKTSLTNSMNSGIMGKAEQGARTTVANASRTGKFGDELLSSGGNRGGGSGGGDSTSYDSDVDPDEPETNDGDDD